MGMAYVIEDGSGLCCFCNTGRSRVVIGRGLLERRCASVTSDRLSDRQSAICRTCKQN